MKKLFILVLFLLVSVSSFTNTKRHSSVRNNFAKTHICPSTGVKSLSCPGYVIDHIIPLASNGPDSVTNMQYQTLVDGIAKDKWERKDCSIYNIQIK